MSDRRVIYNIIHSKQVSYMSLEDGHIICIVGSEASGEKAIIEVKRKRGYVYLLI